MHRISHCQFVYIKCITCTRDLTHQLCYQIIVQQKRRFVFILNQYGITTVNFCQYTTICLYTSSDPSLLASCFSCFLPRQRLTRLLLLHAASSDRLKQPEWQTNVNITYQWYFVVYHCTFRSLVHSEQTGGARTCMCDFWSVQWMWSTSPMDAVDSRSNVREEPYKHGHYPHACCTVDTALPRYLFLNCFWVCFGKEVEKHTAEVVRVTVWISKLVCNGIQKQIST